MNVLITGASGLVGRQLAERLKDDFEVLALTHRALDITDRDAVFERLAIAKPSLVINCAVIPVDDCERDRKKADAVNFEGPRNLAEAATEFLSEFVHFSTNYVFGGLPLGRPPYTVNDIPDPINVYGETKAAGEAAVRKGCARSYIIRTAWVYGREKENFFSSVYAALAANRPVRAINNVWANTTFVKDLVDRVFEILLRRRFGTYHVVNAGICSYHDFAFEAGRLAGLSRGQLKKLINAVTEEESQRPAKRPRYTPMRCLRSEEIGLPPMRDWRLALAEYVGS
ncbi:MAG TPA: dTDP-4-dehydrorhamnose reductase [Terriglobales bacterium]|nr:dTDP-4-dehydrorhamnose reductase [Terriglobales bacterium]